MPNRLDRRLQTKLTHSCKSFVGREFDMDIWKVQEGLHFV